MLKTTFRARVSAAWRDNKVAFLFIGIAGLILIVFTFSKTRLTTNPRSRIITVERLLDAGTLAHKSPTDSSAYALSIDMVRIGDNYYSSKPPIYSLLMAAETWPLHKIMGGTFKEHDKSYVRYLVLINQVLPYLLMMLIALLWVRDQTESKWTQNFMMAVLSIGTLPFGYAVTLNNHTPTAFFFFFAFYILYRMTVLEKESVKNFMLMGLLCGLGFAFEVTSGIFAVIFIAFAFFVDWKKWYWTLLFAMIPIAFSSLYYFQLSGSPMPFYLQSHLYHFEGSHWDKTTGLDQQTDPWHLYLFNMILGHHGLFSLSPVLLLGAGGFVWGWKNGKLPFKYVFLGIVGGMAVVTLFLIIRTHNYGGFCIGMRWFIQFMPLLALMALPLVDKMRQSLGGKILCIALLLLSIWPNVQALYYEAFVQSWLELGWWQVFGLPG